MQNASIKLALTGLGISLLLAGCAPAPIYDSKFGEAFNTVKAQQTLNPDASLNQNPSAGLDGQAGTVVIDKYHKSFEKPAATSSTFTIGVGSGGGGSQ